jgi:GST-like protein
MLDFYFNAGPNPMKVALFLEEAGLAYKLIPVDMFCGQQFSPEFIALNPNSKVPVVVDNGTAVFDSNAILLYLSEKSGQFLPAPEHRGAMLSWLMFIATGLGPYSGQAVHFRHYAPEPKEYAQQRYTFEARRHFDVLNGHLAGRDWMVGDDYSFVDMALWGWARNMDHILGPDARADLPDLVRLIETVEARPAAQRAATFPAKFAFKREFDDEARRNMFRHANATQ